VIRTRTEKALFVALLFTALTGMGGGLALMLEPSGQPLGIDQDRLAGTMFSDWFWPGLLLGLFVGLGFLIAAIWVSLWGWGANELAIFAGVGLIAFETVEFAIFGFHVLQPLYAVIGLVVIVLGFMARADSAARRV